MPPSHGQWGGFNTTLALAWVIDIGSTAGCLPAWLARCRDQCRDRSCGPLPFNKAKAAAFAMLKGAAGDALVAKLQAEAIALKPKPQVEPVGGMKLYVWPVPPLLLPPPTSGRRLPSARHNPNLEGHTLKCVEVKRSPTNI